MACGDLEKVKCLAQKIFKEIKDYFFKRDIVKNKKFKALVTAGPTREYLDQSVLFLTSQVESKDMKLLWP